MRLKGKTAIVTGASRGIGRAIALAFAKEGAEVVVNYHQNEKLAKEVAQKIEAMGWRALVIKADVSNSKEVKTMVERTLEEFGKIDILVNNAGITQCIPVFDTTEEDWDRMLDTNLKSAFLCTKAVLDSMVKQKSGRIINISSTVAKSGGIGTGVHYCAAKAGLIGLTKALANQLAPYGILVNAIAPAMIDTEMIRWRTPEQMAAVIEQIPLKRLGRVEETAETAVFLASDGANFITGATIDVNGGLYMD